MTEVRMTGDGPRWLPLPDLRKRRSYKWQAYAPDVLPAFVAEMDVTLAKPIADALAEAVACGDTGYAFPDPALGDAVARYHAERHGWQHDPSAVVLIPDVMSGIGEILARSLPQGSGVVVNTPVYPPFFRHIDGAGCRVAEAPLARAGAGYALDLDAVERAFRSGAAAYLLCNPHNPTGLVLTAGELVLIAQLADRYGALVLADEIHAPLVMPGVTHVPYLSLEAAQAHGIALVSASKAWNLPGLKCAQMVTASQPMRELVAGLPVEISFRASNLGVTASIAAYREGGRWLDELLVLLDRNRALLAGLLAKHLPEVGFSPPQGTYLAWLDCSRLGLTGEPAQVFLDRGRVALRAGPDFGNGGQGFARATIATAPEILVEIIDRMKAAVN